VLLASASLGVSLYNAPFLLRLACWLNRARRRGGVVARPSERSPVASMRAALLERMVEDAATTVPPFGQLDNLDSLAPELAHELLVWLLAENACISADNVGSVGSGGGGGSSVGNSEGGFSSLPPLLASVLLGWLGRKPELLLPLVVGGSDDSDVMASPLVEPDGTADPWSSGLALTLCVVRAAVAAAQASSRASVAVALHESVLRALASAASPSDALTRVAAGASPGLPAVVCDVGPCTWPSMPCATFLRHLPPGSLGQGDSLRPQEPLHVTSLCLPTTGTLVFVQSLSRPLACSANH
jgi:hypothetical protein